MIRRIWQIYERMNPYLVLRWSEAVMVFLSYYSCDLYVIRNLRSFSVALNV